jgi:hypothetical protein
MSVRCDFTKSMSKNRSGLVFGSFIALFHLVWSVFVALIPNQVQTFINWVLKLHHISLPYTIVTPFVLMNAVILVIYTFIVGYIFGWIFAAMFNMFAKKQ